MEKGKFEEELRNSCDTAWQAARYAMSSSGHVVEPKSAARGGDRPGKNRRGISWKGRRIHWREGGHKDEVLRTDNNDERSLQSGNRDEERPHRGGNERYRSQIEMNKKSEAATGGALQEQPSPERRNASDVNQKSTSAQDFQQGELLRTKTEAIEERRKTRTEAARREKIAGVRRCISKWLPL